MNADWLLAHYERIADAPEAVPRLRRFILDLAVRSKLVEQDPNDEPASELLGVISSTREEMVKASKVKRPKRLLPIADEDVLYDVPKSWSWAQANDLWDFENGDRSKNYPSRDQLVQSGIPFVNAGHLVDGRVSMFQMNFITPEKYQQLGGGKLKKGDQLYCLRGSLGKHAIYDHEGEGAIASSLVILRPIEQQCVPYLSIYLESNIAGQMLRRFDNGSAQPNLSSANLRKYEIPLPPLAEQHRIVAKADELMALCDRLEAARTEREATRDRMAAASLVRLNDPDPDRVVFRNHAAFAIENLAPLTTRTDQIKSLRQTILNLAVRGKLVEQDPIEGTGQALLFELRKIRNTWETSGRVRKQKVKNAVADDEQYLDLPTSWAWTRLIDVGQTQTGTSPSSAITELFGDFMPFVKPADLDGNKINYGGPGLSEKGVDHSRLVPENSVLMVCIGATLGKVNKTTRSVCFNQQINSLTPFVKGVTGFVALALKASSFQELAWSKAGTGTLPIISKGKWEVLPVPLPPLAEQHRIVAKVDELMTLCDQLEANLATGDDTRHRLLDALLHEVLSIELMMQHHFATYNPLKI